MRGSAALGATLTALLVVFVLGNLSWSPTLWGVNSWSFLGWPARAAVVAVALVAAAMVLMPPPFPTRARGVGLFAAAGLPVFYLLRDRAHLLGDGQLWLGVLRGPRTHHAHEPLAFAFSWLTTSPVAGGAPERVAAYAEATSVVLGGLWVAVALLVAARLADSPRGRWFVFLLLLGSATVQFAFGYVEAYPLLWWVMLVYVWVGVLALQGSLGLFLPTVLAAVAVAVHGSAVLLLPSLFVLLARAPRSRRGALAGVVVGAGVVAFAYLLLPRWLPGASASGASFKDGVAALLPGLSWYPHGLPAWSLDQLNRWMLLAPGALLLGVAGLLHRPRALHARGAFLLAAAAVSLPALLVDTEGSRGASLDWDSFSVGVVPLLAAVALWWAPVLDARRRAWTPGLAVGCVWLFAGSFVAVNACPDAAVARYAHLVEHASHWEPRTRAMAWETLGIFHREEGNTAAAAAAYAQASNLDRGNVRLARNAASFHLRAGGLRPALDIYLALAERSPEDPDLWYRAGMILQTLSAADSARAAYEEAIRRGTEEPDVFNRLARVILSDSPTSADSATARFLLRRSLELDPRQPGNREVRGVLDFLQGGGDSTP